MGLVLERLLFFLGRRLFRFIVFGNDEEVHTVLFDKDRRVQCFLRRRAFAGIDVGVDILWEVRRRSHHGLCPVEFRLQNSVAELELNVLPLDIPDLNLRVGEAWR